MAQSVIEQIIPVSETNVSGNEVQDSYIKYPDGTLICTKRIYLANRTLNTVWGSLYYGNREDLGTWPVPFISRPIVVISGSYGGEFICGRINSPDSPNSPLTHVGNMYLYSPVTSTGSDFRICVVGIGRWK